MSDRARLEVRVSALEASLVDLERERANGDLTDARYRELVARDQAALAEARSALGALDDVAVAPPTRPARRRPRRRLFIALGAFLVAAVVVLVSSLTPRQAGDSVTGQLNLDRAQRVARLLTQAEVAIAAGNTSTALAAYQQVLTLAPRNVTALTQVGWLTFSAGSASHNPTLVQRGEEQLARAVALAPRNPAPHLYQGIVALSVRGATAKARAQFVTFLRLHPSKGQLAVAAPFLAQLGIKPATS